jgi:hypothetical protein
MIVSPHNGQGIDGITWKMAELIAAKSKLPIVPISRVNGFIFNTDLYRLGSFVLIDMIELDWNHDYEKTGTHLFGENTKDFDYFNNDEWKKFDEWVDGNKPTLYLKRELLKKDVSDIVKPIDYFNWIGEVPLQTQEEFNKRILDCFFFWGRSHEGRLQIHSDIWRGATKYGYSVCDNLMYLQDFVANEQGRKWCTLWMPHYKRIDISIILSVNNIAKISLAPFGAGRKTFRHLEASVNAAMLTWEDNFAWAYEWKNEINCLKCEQGKEAEAIEKWSKNPNLYYIYKAGVENAKKYLPENYIKDYLEPLINEVA